MPGEQCFQVTPISYTTGISSHGRPDGHSGIAQEWLKQAGVAHGVYPKLTPRPGMPVSLRSAVESTYSDGAYTTTVRDGAYTRNECGLPS